MYVLLIKAIQKYVTKLEWSRYNSSISIRNPEVQSKESLIQYPNSILKSI